MGDVLYFQNLKSAGLPAGTKATSTGTIVGTSTCLDVAPKNTALTPLFVSAAMTPNANGSGSAASDTVTTAGKTLVKPANAVGFILMCLDSSTSNVRWSVGRTASTTLGQQLQPGRDTGFIPLAASVTVCAEAGTQDIDIQWVIQ